MMATAQRPAMELTFTAINNATWVHLDSIKIMNRSQGGDTVLFYPDTVFVIDYVGIPEIRDGSGAFSVQCYPNPVTDQATISLFIPVEDNVSIRITDLQGRQALKYEQNLAAGTHSFTFTPGTESLYLLNAAWGENNQGIKIINLPDHPGKTCSLTYSGYDKAEKQVKAIEAVQSFNYTPGDTLLYIGYADTLQSGILDNPESSETYAIQFATNIPCPGTPTVDYEGQVYNTIQIFSQCWLKENLNVGTMIQGTESMADNGIIEKYCYNNEYDSCTKYGGLYQWREAMQYTTQQGARGICPTGWHIPTDEEWKVLNGAVDSYYGIGNPEWDTNSVPMQGFDVGNNMKTTNGWYLYNGTDKFGFSALPGGSRWSTSFHAIGELTPIWSSTKSADYYDAAWYRILYFWTAWVGRFEEYSLFGFSVRCVRDY